MSDIMAMVTSGTSNDVVIVLEDGEIMANKDVLSARSDYFATMFTNYKDVKFVEGETNKVDMSHCTKVIMEKIIKYLFSGDMELHDLTLPELVKMLNMTSMMMLDDIHEDIKEYVLERIPGSGESYATIPELVNAVMLAENFNLKPIKKVLAWELCGSLKDVPHIPDVVQHSEVFKKLPINLLKEILEVKEDDGKHEDDKNEDENECSDEDKKKIKDSIQLDSGCFTAEKLLTDVRRSGLYSIEEIDNSVLEVFERVKWEVEKKKLINYNEDDFCFLRMLYDEE